MRQSREFTSGTAVLVILWCILLTLSPAGAQCTKDTDCKGDRICVEGECVEPGKENTETEEPAMAGPMGKGYLNFHPLGLAQFGPIVQLGINLGGDLFLTAHYRYHALGLVSQAIAWSYDADRAKFSSMAVGTGMLKHVAFSHKSHRFFAGGMIDFGWGGSIADDESWDDEELWESDVLTLAIVTNAGYRFRFSNGLMLGVGGFAGAGFELKDEVTHTGVDPQRTEKEDNDVWPFVMLEGSIGFEF